MPHPPPVDEVSSGCSSLSSPDAVSDGDHANEHLIDLLTRPRSRGGYGGRLNYGEFSTLARSLGWNSEDMDDCWYDIMMGEPSAEAVDMARVAECVCSYCLASPLPLLETYTLHHTPSGSSQGAEDPLNLESEKRPVGEEGRASGGVVTPPRSTTPPALPNTTVVLSPPSPKAAAAPTPPHSPHHPSPRQKASPARKTGLRRFPRYAVDTASSERKKASASPVPPQRAEQRVRTTSKSPSRKHAPADAAATAATAAAASAAAAASPTPSAVFFRLYENGLEQQRKRHAAKPVESAAECTFKPHIKPYPTKERDVGTVHYNKPTQSYFAKLTEEEKSADRDPATTPETPRVAYRPAPGPSSSVPAGYVEGVARLRQYVASRYANAEFTRSLRDPVRHDVQRLVEAPILRLPVTVEGVADAVDVRLASAPSRSPSRRRASYSERAETVSAASTPREHAGGMVRYKSHPVLY